MIKFDKKVYNPASYKYNSLGFLNIELTSGRDKILLGIS